MISALKDKQKRNLLTIIAVLKVDRNISAPPIYQWDFLIVKVITATGARAPQWPIIIGICLIKSETVVDELNRHHLLGVPNRKFPTEIGSTGNRQA